MGWQGFRGRVTRLPVAVWDVAVALVVIVLQVGATWGIPRSHDPDVVAALSGFGEPSTLGYVPAVLGGAALVLRRRAPVPVLGVATAMAVVLVVLDVFIPPFAMMVAAYTVGSRSQRRDSLAWVLAFLLAALVTLAAIGALQLANAVVFVGAAWVVGDRQRTRRTYLAELEDRAARLERERDDRDRLAVAAERSRIARELHDVVAHSVSVMVVQAGAARHNLRSSPRRAEEAIREVEATGRQSLVELRRLLGVLRVEDGEAALRPQPRLVDLDELVHRFAEAGLPVHLERRGEPRPLPQGVDLSLYRVVQEALTNSLKHAAASRVLVRLRYAVDEVSVSVEDDGRGSSSALAGGGNGLVGMRERAALLGGVLAFGPRPEGGFGVEMTIPLETGAARPSGVAPTG